MPRRRRSSTSNDSAEIQTASREARQRRAERAEGSRWLRRLAYFGVALLVFVALLPNLIGWTPLKQIFLDRALADFEGRVTVDRLSLGWLQRIQADGVHVVDREGNAMADIDTVRSSHRLLSFLTGSDLGSFEILKPHLRVVTRDGGSNFEDAAKTYLETPATEPSAALPRVSISVLAGQIELASVSDPHPWNLNNLNAEIVLGEVAAITANLTASVFRDDQVGVLEAQLSLDDQSPTVNGDNGSLQVKTNDLPLGSLAPLLERVVGKSALTGRVHGDINLSFTQGGAFASLDFVNSNIQGLQVSIPKFLGRDVVSLNKIVATGHVATTPQGAEAKNWVVTSDVGRISTDGQFDWNQFSRLAEEQVLVATPFQLDGQLDLARLTQLLPDTLKVYEDLQVESGEIRCQINSRPEQGMGRLVVNVDTANIVAIRDGKRLAWQQPLRLVSTVAQRNGNWSLDELKCQSDFLTIDGSATQKQGRFQVDGDLSILMQRLAQFVDTQGWGIQGKVSGNLNWDNAQTNSGAASSVSLVNVPLQFSGVIDIAQPMFSLPGMKAWRENQIKMELEGTGTALVNGSASIDAADVLLTMGGEQARIRLHEPIADLFKQSRWQAQCAMGGSLAKWLGHAGVFYDLSFLDTDGDTVVNFLASMDAQQLVLSDLRYQVNNWMFRGYGFTIDEPQVSGEGLLKYDFKTAVVQMPEITMTCSGFAARGDNVALQYASFLDASGAVAFRADTHRILSWLGMFPAADSIHYFGGAEGNLKFASSAEFIQGELAGKITDFVAAQAQRGDGTQNGWKELLRESQIDVQSLVGLRQDFDQLTFKDLTMVASSVQVKTTGSLTDLAGSMVADIEGTWSPDWIRVQALLDAYAYNQVKLAGRQQLAFSVNGPMFNATPTDPWPPQDLRVVSKLAWDQGVVFLLPLGAAEVTSGIVNGQATVQTGEIPFSGGVVTLSPTYDLRAAVPVVALPAGPVATNVTLTPEICRDWLKFVAPLIADVTSAEGKVSLETTGVSLPLTDLNTATGRGVIKLTDVTLGAGPLGKQLIAAVENLQAILKPNAVPDGKDRSVWLRLEEQSVPIAIANGRVHHDQMQIRVKDVTMTTQGSVGFDQSISMTVAIPILDDWIAGERLLSGLQGQSITIPITGTLSAPKLDFKAMQNLSLQIVQRTAANELTAQTEKLQNKLGSEVEKIQGQLGGEIEKVQTKLNDKVQGELLKGINGLFGPKKDK